MSSSGVSRLQFVKTSTESIFEASGELCYLSFSVAWILTLHCQDSQEVAQSTYMKVSYYHS